MATNTETLRIYIEKRGLAKLCLREEPLAPHTSFKIGGPAELFVVPKNGEAVEEILGQAKALQVPCFILGNGSNVLFSDGGKRGLVLCLKEGLDTVTVEGNCLCCGAGALLSTVAARAKERSLAGFAFAAGIPGSIGGATYMNAGAYGGEMGQVVASTLALLPDGTKRVFRGAEHEFAYRHSVFCSNQAVILEVRLELSAGDGEEIGRRMAELASARREKQPLNYPSAGSTFKRPEGHFAGKLIEDAGLKGLSVGGAQISEKHAGFVVNKGCATAADVLALIAVVQERVYAHSGIHLETEVKVEE